MSRIIFEKLTVEEEEKVRGGLEEEKLSLPAFCDPDGMPPTRDCLPQNYV